MADERIRKWAKPVTTHEDFSRYHDANQSSDRSFGVVFTLAFGVIGFWPLLRHRPARWWSVGISLIFGLLAFAAPSALRPLNRTWTRLGLLLNTLTNPIVMGILFFLVFTPIALLMRLFGSDPLSLRYDPTRTTYWLARTPPGPPPETMPHQF